MISTTALIEKFKYTLNNKWGYIWGTAGEYWSKEKQNQKVQYMVSNFGTNWKTSESAKDNKYYMAAMYGSKWENHQVSDCSGLFHWAFKQLGGYMYHGSDTMYRKYCTSNGTMSNGKRSDGKTLLPGTAVFTYNDKKKNYGHVGLYIGNGKVIEAQGTKAGVIQSSVTLAKWKYWGELKDVDYSGASPEPEPEPTPEPDKKPTLRKGMKGDAVKWVQEKLIAKGYDLGSWGADGSFGAQTEKAVKEFQQDHGLTADGVVGAKTYAALEEKGTNLYTVTIPHLPKFKAETFVKDYSGATMKEEGA